MSLTSYQTAPPCIKGRQRNESGRGTVNRFLDINEFGRWERGLETKFIISLKCDLDLQDVIGSVPQPPTPFSSCYLVVILSVVAPYAPCSPWR